MKVTLVQPRYFNIWEALGLGYVGAYLKTHSRGPLEVNFFQAFFDTDEEIVRGAADSDVVGFSCTSPAFAHGAALARAIKAVNPRAWTVFGGFHPSAAPDDCLATPGVDAIVRGEGERAFLEIVEGNRARDVKGDPVADLDTLPFPDRALIRNERDIALAHRYTGQRMTSFQSCRVCPLRCAFCAERAVTGVFHRATNPVREIRAARLLDEIQAVTARYALDHFKFVDATWNTSPEKVIAFCQEKIARGFTLPWEANVHAAFTTREMFRWMKEAACVQINVGCESGSPRILRDMRKGISVEKVAQVFAWAREVGIKRRAYFIMGMPNETEEDLLLTEALAVRLEPEVFGVTIVCPYPGTDLYDPIRHGGTDWSKTDEYSNDFWATKHLSNADLKRWQKRLTEKFRDAVAWHHTVRENPGLVPIVGG
jgi:anaerobic magnesium-protoporphyrin IX monomethyl ester cyclase